MKRDVLISRNRHQDFFLSGPYKNTPESAKVREAKKWLTDTDVRYKWYGHDNCIIVQFNDGVEAALFRMAFGL